MKKALFLVIILSISLITEAQTVYQQDQPNPSENLPVPPEIKAKSDGFIVSKIGEARFNSWIKFDTVVSKGHQETIVGCNSDNPACIVYLLVYHMKVPEKSFVNYTFSFEMDGHGHIIFYDKLPQCIENRTHANCVYGTERIALPDCVNKPSECEFPIDAARAKEIAANAGLEKGKGEWDLRFGFGDNTFVWHVNSIIESNSIGDATIKTMAIDANSGEVLGTSLGGVTHAPAGERGYDPLWLVFGAIIFLILLLVYFLFKVFKK